MRFFLQGSLLQEKPGCTKPIHVLRLLKENKNGKKRTQKSLRTKTPKLPGKAFPDFPEEWNPSCSEHHPGLGLGIGKSTEWTMGWTSDLILQPNSQPREKKSFVKEKFWRAESRKLPEQHHQEGREDGKWRDEKNPEVFKSSSVCVQKHLEELRHPTEPQREGKTWPGKFPRFPSRSSSLETAGSACSTQAGDGWDVTAVSPPNWSWWPSGVTLGWGKSCLQLLEAHWCQKKLGRAEENDNCSLNRTPPGVDFWWGWFGWVWVSLKKAFAEESLK